MMYWKRAPTTVISVWKPYKWEFLTLSFVYFYSLLLFPPSPGAEFSGVDNVEDHLSSAARDSTIINKGAGRSVDLNWNR